MIKWITDINKESFMTETLISLVSILVGIVGASLTGYLYKRYSFGLVGNSIAGVFGSIFFIKSLGKLGFDPISIMQQGSVNYSLFILNMIVSFFGGVIAIILIKKIKTGMSKTQK